MLPFAYRVFQTIVQEQTFYRAAQTLNVTPSAISHSVNQLEKELGFPLFIRNRTGVELTPDGKTVLPLIQAIINAEDRLQQAAANINGMNAGSVRMGAFSSVCINWLPPIIRQFKQDYPEISINVEQADFSDIAAAVKTGRLDLGFSALPVSEKLTVLPLVKDEIYCITPTDFIPANRTTVTAADLIDQNFILQRGDYDKDTKAALDHYKIRPNALRFSIDDQSILAMVEAGMGMGILPELALERVSGNVNVYPFDTKFFRTICLVVNSEQAKAPSTAKMIAAITAYVTAKYPDKVLAHPHVG
ncbi:LysR family transcriptional regulator [Levilactobacillus tujiorum]|uniref:LysR family transcriptional regulator n=1 Tax=Levilactobacillus tujiorum TaxID=2912243 RepID=A0ABX1L2D7_9LACO|nr:LysR family transcriptional regulator [Levilactobacillus tujiorum]MCH5464083.1 LysR family transcriptional regulator [Levilactobacillus tujiorum]NLR11183.1 LysR family transcriptional regulator [Lactobacillus sp. HBUAS51387]NLR29190.1 LysR family transcriptional regulator [Levilactobacillus tujiorum]NLR31504.1 LysR family transcriptional regulator [Levilactobacillus tujiorum]